MPLHAFLAQSDACIGHDTVATVGQIKCPTLITIGDQDIFTPMKFSEQLNDLIEGSEMLVLPGTGHAHHWEDLETFNTKTAEFMLNN